jgi:trimeric autotransporter adhesin
MRLRRYLLNSCIALAMLCSLLSAQQPAAPVASAVVPRLVNFFGKALDADGKTISGVAGVTFAIYQEQSGGAPLWIETQNVQAGSKGSYTAQLGATKPDGLPLDLFTSGAARWLGVTLNGTGSSRGFFC